MPRLLPKQLSAGRLAILSWIGCATCMGCAGHRYLAETTPAVAPERMLASQPIDVSPTNVSRGSVAERVSHQVIEHQSSNTFDPPPSSSEVAALANNLQLANDPPLAKKTVRPVNHERMLDSSDTSEANPTGTLTINGREYRIELAETEPPVSTGSQTKHSLVGFRNPAGNELVFPEVVELPSSVQPFEVAGRQVTHPVQEMGFDNGMPGVSMIDALPEGALPANLIDLNLPSALAMIDGRHPAVGMAQWRVQEAYARLAQAEVLWLPSIQAGFSLHRHDGNYQASDGDIVDVNRNSFQYGLGMGATGAGTTQRPGLVAEFHLADAIFQPDIAEKTAWAHGHAAKAVVNEQLMNVAIAYNELLDAHQDSRILEESRSRMAELFRITNDFAEAGEGLRADADRVETELILMDSRIVEVNEQTAMASARLAEALSIDASNQIMPTDLTVVPLELIPVDSDKSGLIQMGLSGRPELKESQALVAAACDAYKREKYAPMVPSVLLGFSSGGFGGGLGGDLENSNSRYDFDALMSWEIRNLGFGEKAARRSTSARVEQAKFEKLRVMDEVARQVSESYSQIQFRRQQLSLTQRAIATAQQSYDRNVSRIRDGQGLPIEVLQSVQALEAARRAYLASVVGYNEAQFRLQWALGWPVSQG